jgi:hypothetical protein
MLNRMARKASLETARKNLFGEVRPIISTEFQGRRFVAVGSELYANPEWNSVFDFLLFYSRHVLGEDWIEMEKNSALDSRHQILYWLDALEQVIQNSEPIGEKVKIGHLDGPSRSYILLAYDIFILRHHEKLQEKLVNRLKHRDQFQGARYELLVAATMIRAGFELEFEDESDRSKKHPEFVARHLETKLTVVVEAKSRHRDGVLGRPGPSPERESFEVGIGKLLNSAARKSGRLPMVVFIDANMPPEIAELPGPFNWQREVDQTVLRVNRASDKTGSPFNLILITNFPDHYGSPGSPLPSYLCKPYRTQNPKFPLPFSVALDAIERSIHQFGNVPQDLQTGI